MGTLECCQASMSFEDIVTKKKKVIKSWYNTDICQNVPFVQIYTSCWGPCWLRDLGECEQSGFDPSWGFGVSVHNIFPRRHLTTEP